MRNLGKVVVALMGAAALTMSASVPAASSVAERNDSFSTGMAAQHKAYRAHYGAEPLDLDPELTRYATRRAQKMAAADGALSRSHGPYGENLFMSWPNQPTAAEVVKAWMDGAAEYDYDNPGFSNATGNFTQVVWKSSKKLGVGLARSVSDRWYVVAVYDPPGNYTGQFAQNVGRYQ
ncbi:CAP family protein [Nonomuraea sp. NPDC049141]|uniref:CAP family protein n=1 Tax=Nonomuraea sp. NPDC049141 TaxID=3155500 RepID=UPI0033C85E51